MAKGTPPVALIALKAPKSKVWHLQDALSTTECNTICGKSFQGWTVQCGLQDGDRLCKHCLRRLDDALGARYQIMDVGAKK